jgi:hypothetical protein
MKKEILKLTGLTEEQFYKMYPTPDAFASAYPGYKKKLGGTPEAFPQIATADNFFSYGVPVPPTYYMSGGPVYPQIQTEAQFFSPVYSNSNNAYAVGGATFPTMDKGGPRKKKKQREAEDLAAQIIYDQMSFGDPTDAYDAFHNRREIIGADRVQELSGMYENSGRDNWAFDKGIYDPGAYANWINKKLGRDAVMSMEKPFVGPYDVTGRVPNMQRLPNQINLEDYEPQVIDSGIDYRTLTPSNQKNYFFDYNDPSMAMGGSYMEAYPQAVKYPTHGMGMSNYFMLADGGAMTPEMSAMPSMGPLPQLAAGSNLFNKTMDSVNHYYGQYPLEEGGTPPTDPASDQTFYTQKNNNFFDKLRKASYKALVKEGMESYSPYPTEAQEVKFGGMPMYQGKKGSGQTNAVANFLYPYRWRNWREKKGMGWGDLSPEEQQYIKDGTADLVKLNSKYRRAIQRGNRLKELTAEFEQGPTPSWVGVGTPLVTLGPPPANASTASTAQTATTTNPTTTTANSTTNSTSTTATTQAAPKNVEIDDGGKALWVTADEAKAKGYTQDANGNWSKPSTAAASTPNAKSISEMSPEEVNEAVAKMQEEAQKRAVAEFEEQKEGTKKSQAPSNAESMDPNVAKKKAAMQNPQVNQEFIDAQQKAPITSINSWADIEAGVGPTPEIITGDYFTKVINYCNQFPGSEGCYNEPDDFDVESYKNIPYEQQVIHALLSPRFRETKDKQIIDPFEVINAPFRLIADYDRGVTTKDKLYTKTTRQGLTTSETPFEDLDPAYRTENTDDPDFMYSQFMTPEMARKLESRIQRFTQKKHGGPYALPKYQSDKAPGQVMTEDPFDGSLAIVDVPSGTPSISWDTNNFADLTYEKMAEKGFYEKPIYMDDFKDRFKVGFDVSKVKKFSPYFAGAIAGAAALANSGSVANQNFIFEQSAADKMFNNPTNKRRQDSGDYLMNEIAGQYFRPNDFVPVQSTGFNVSKYGGMPVAQPNYRQAYGGSNFPFEYDTANLYFLTPQMLKKTRKIS